VAVARLARWLGHFAATKDHWSDAITSIDYLDNVIVPDMMRVKQELNLPEDQAAVYIVDTWWQGLYRVQLLPDSYCERYMPDPYPATSSTRVLNPRFLSQTASYDVASNICQGHSLAHSLPRHRHAT